MMMQADMHGTPMTQDKAMAPKSKNMATKMPMTGKTKMPEKNAMTPEDIARGYRVVR
jgi:hypothetical protein